MGIILDQFIFILLIYHNNILILGTLYTLSILMNVLYH
jgi:hypothetical protein